MDYGWPLLWVYLVGLPVRFILYTLFRVHSSASSVDAVSCFLCFPLFVHHQTLCNLPHLLAVHAFSRAFMSFPIRCSNLVQLLGFVFVCSLLFGFIFVLFSSFPHICLLVWLHVSPPRTSRLFWCSSSFYSLLSTFLSETLTLISAFRLAIFSQNFRSFCALNYN